ncbi:MAG: PFL family protein [Abditibacteriota bacterium]|nr:PFL family protein [Abditibacteriota bacterium]
MIATVDIMSTIQMIQNEKLDVRAVNMGIDLFDCSDRDINTACRLMREKIVRLAEPLPRICDHISRKYGIPVVNRRVAVSPVADVLSGHGIDELAKFADTMNSAAEEAGIDIIGGYSAMVQKGMTDTDKALIESLPRVLSETGRLCSSVNAASTKAGINVDALILLGHTLKEIAQRTEKDDGFGCCKLSIFANMPEDNPFMSGAYKGIGEPETVINIGVSGPGVVKRAIERAVSRSEEVDLAAIAEEIKYTAYRVTKVGEMLGREVAKEIGAEFGIVDLSLAPTPAVGDSVGEIFEAMGISHIGGPGNTAALALLNDAVKKGGTFASGSVGGLSGAFIPVAEDSALAGAAEEGWLSIEKLEAMTSVCSVGLDMIAVPGYTSPETLTAICMDELAIGVINRKTTSVRIIPVPGKKPGDRAVFGGLFGESPVMDIKNNTSSVFVRHGGRIPAPLTSLNN